MMKTTAEYNEKYNNTDHEVMKAGEGSPTKLKSISSNSASKPLSNGSTRPPQNLKETSKGQRKKVNSYLNQLNSLPKLSKIEYKFNAISVFSGGGGLDLGAAWASFHVKFASDVEQTHCDTIEYNFSDCSTLCTEVERLTKNKIVKKIGDEKIHLLIGGPPCQAFSILGKRQSVNDPRGMLIYDYARLVDELKPEAFIFENVPGLLTVNGGKDWEDFLLHLESGETKYKLFVKPLNAADYGIPQIRQRIFIVGFKNQKAEFNFPVPTHQKEIKEISDEFSDKSKCNDKFWRPARLALENLKGKRNHRIRIHGERVRERYKKVAPGGKDKIDHTARIHPDKPAGTVLVGSKSGGGRPHIHPKLPRHITVREAARLQSFPDWYFFQGTDTWQYRAVGNAVPPLLGRAICLEIASTLEKLSEVPDK